MAQFPSQEYNGIQGQRDDLSDRKDADHDDYIGLVREVQALQKFFLTPDTIANVPWTVLPTLQNSWTGSAAKYRRVGARVELTGVITAGTKTTGTLVTTLPAGCRPTTALCVPVCPDSGGTGDANMRILIGTDGTIKVYGMSSTTTVDLASVRFHTDQ